MISVEIVLKTNRPCSAWVKWFEAQDNYVAKLKWHTHKWYVYFAPIPGKDANTTIRKFCKMIAKLPPNIRKVWDQADHREFYIGYHGGEGPLCYEEHIELETLRAAIELGAGIGLAIYPAPLTDKNGVAGEI